MQVDLHAHTTASDGSLSPTDLVARAQEAGLSALGITDHDTIGGWEEALAAAAVQGIEIVPGVELSTSYERGRFHILGYYVRPASILISTLESIQMARRNRNGEILSNLIEMGYPLHETEVREISGSHNGQLGRPHFALAMVKRGYVATTQEAFDRFLADGMPAYASKTVLSPEEAIEQIHSSGGVAVWAHPPIGRKVSLQELEVHLPEFVSWGLDGLETFYSRYTEEEAEWTETMRQKYDLLACGGSDFHGSSKPDVQIGKTHTGAGVPYCVLDAVRARRDSLRAAQSAHALGTHS